MAALIVSLPGNNHPIAVGFAVIFTGVLSILIAGVLDFVLPVRWRSSRFFWLVPGLAVGVWIGSLFMLTGAIAFERAFRMPVPADVDGLSAEGYYVPGNWGPPSDLWIFLLLDADHDLLDRLITKAPAARDSELEKWWAEDPEYVWQSLFGGFTPNAGAVWQAPPTTGRIEIHQIEFEGLESTRIFWDGTANRVYALYTLG